MTANKNIFRDEERSYPDWIELYNSSNASINLKGCGLSRDKNRPYAWVFPEMTIPGKSYLILYASGKNKLVYFPENRGSARGKNSPDKEEMGKQERSRVKKIPSGKAFYLHTNFTLSKGDDFLIFSDPGGHIIDLVEIRKAKKGHSIARVHESGKWEWTECEHPSPGFANTEKGYNGYMEEREDETSPLIITELMASNKNAVINDDGTYTDWIELHNGSQEPVSLQDYLLSDERDNLFKWRFPDVIILPDQYLVIFASDKKKPDTQHTYLHTSFSLDAAKDELYLSDPYGFVLDSVKIFNHPANVSYGRMELNSDEWSFLTFPSPGKKNREPGSSGTSSISEKNTLSLPGGLYISEVIPKDAASGNSSPKLDEDNELHDIIELHNNNTYPVNLMGYYLTDDPTNLHKWPFPEILLPPGEYLFVFASGKDRHSSYIHTNFKIGKDDDEIILFHSTAGIIDSLEIKEIPRGTSFGRPPGTQIPVYYKDPTPGKKNSTGYYGTGGTVLFSHQGGHYSDPIILRLSVDQSEIGDLPDTGIQQNVRDPLDDNENSIYYTLDGSEPDLSAYLYTKPLRIQDTTILRARSFKTGYLPGNSVTHTFFFNVSTHLPVISLVTDPSHLRDPLTGILADHNITRKLEKPVHIEFFEKTGVPGFRINAGIRLFGHSTRLMEQRPFYLLTRKRYGDNVINYRVFPDKDIRIFRSLLLRNGGEDGKYSRIRDAFTTTLARELGIDAQASSPVVVYLNGTYWGQYYVRDKIDEYFLAFHHNIPHLRDIDLVEGNQHAMNGSAHDLINLRHYIATHDLRNHDAYTYVVSQVDIENLIHYELAQIFFANTDMGNIRCWRENVPGGKWRWILFDTDWSLFSPDRNAFAYNLNPGGRGYLHYFSTTIITGLLKNPDFKKRFITRCLEILETTFSPPHTNALIDRLIARIEPEMDEHYKRWEGTVEGWRHEAERVRHFTKVRPEYMRIHLKEYFGLTDKELEGYHRGNQE